MIDVKILSKRARRLDHKILSGIILPGSFYFIETLGDDELLNRWEADDHMLWQEVAKKMNQDIYEERILAEVSADFQLVPEDFYAGTDFVNTGENKQLLPVYKNQKRALRVVQKSSFYVPGEPWFSKVIVLPYPSLFLSMSDHHLNENPDHIHVHFLHNTIWIKYVKADTLQLLNRFPFKNAEDILYFLSLNIDRLDIDLSQTKIFYSGMLQHDEFSLSLLNRHIGPFLPLIANSDAGENDVMLNQFPDLYFLSAYAHYWRIS